MITSNLPRLHKPRLLLRDPLQQFRCRLVVPVLWYKLAAHGQIENEAAQSGNGVRRVGDAFILFEKSLPRASASARIAFSWSRRCIVSASASFRLLSNSCGSPWSSGTSCGFL